MGYGPDKTDVKDGSSAQRLVLRITDLNDNGDAGGGFTRDQVVVEGIIGSPEGRSLGSPGDVRLRQDLPQIWQKGSGSGRSRTGWVLVAGADTSGCPSTVLTVGPDCQFETIQSAIDFADANLSPSLTQTVVVQVAPGEYTEDLTLRPFIEVEGIGSQLPVNVIGSAAIEIATGNPLSAFILRKITLTPAISINPTLTIGGADVVTVRLEEVQVTGVLSYLNSNADSDISIFRSAIEVGAIPAAIVLGGNAASTCTIEYSSVSVGLPGSNIAIDVNSGRLVTRYVDIDGIVDFAASTTGLLLFSQLNGSTQESMTIGAGASVEAYNCDMRSNNGSGSVVSGGGGTLEFANMTLSGTAKDFTGATITDQSEAYDEAVGANWSNTSPLTVKNALDRIAAAVGPIA